MESAEHMSDSKFYSIATEKTQSNSAAAYMLAAVPDASMLLLAAVPDASSKMEANTFHKIACASKTVAASTIEILQRCVLISLSDVTDGQSWG